MREGIYARMTSGLPDAEPAEAIEIMAREMPEGGAVGGLGRQAFYAQARQGFAVVRCTESRPFGGFILRKGVIFCPPAGAVGGQYPPGRRVVGFSRARFLPRR